ncbi:TRAP transporter small permease [Phreatobacter aquaticus]|uniref:TRAP transporter small permease protein n=1 Tax=Phreatobacter aquaticus TaxID=2570229 RepID=A0A4D7QE12_9HYPH|nr:TRAP transporter small permease [Phreatobacter aquaticus]QCK85438.1 TRAP transporter small permease [Phreatobacter aquaticus]
MLTTLINATAFGRRGVAAIGTAMGYIAGWGFIAISCLITFDVLARKFLGFSTQATTELSGYALAFGIAWGLSHTLTMRAHVRIDILVNKFPDTIRYWLHLMSLGFLGVFMGYLAYGSYMLVDESLLFGATDISILRTPLAIPQGLWAFGICVMMLLIVLMFVENLLLILAGRGAESEAMLHTRTYAEEVAETLEAVGMEPAAEFAAATAPAKEPRS